MNSYGDLEMKTRLLTAVNTCFATLISISSHAASVSGQGSWESTLQGRDLDGNTATIEAYYDTVLDITWLADANAGAGSTFDDGTSTTDGKMTWVNASDWAANLNTFGITGWRLPTVTDTGTPGCNFSYSGTDCGHNADTATGEMAHMFYSTLGNIAYYDTNGNPNQPGWGLSNTGPFNNLQFFSYWTDTPYVTTTNLAWHFDFILGHQGEVNVSNNQYAWAVHQGDVGTSTVPLPSALLLFASGFLGLFGASYQNRGGG